MRITYFAHYAGGVDAASTMDADLFASIRSQGHEVVVLSPFRDPDAGRVGGSVAAGRLPRLALSIPGYARMLREGLSRRGSGDDVLASQYHAFHPATFVAFLVARLRGRPLVVRAHDPLPAGLRSGLEASVHRSMFRVYRGVLRHPETHVLVPSPELEELLAARLGLPRERVVVCPNNLTPPPRPATEAIERVRDRLGLRGHPVVLRFGSFTRGGVPTFVEAVRRLARPDVRAVVVADPEFSAAFAREASERGIGANVVLPGRQPAEDLRALVEIADVCVGHVTAEPSASGALPRNTMEAMAAGRPVIVCRGIVSASLAVDGHNVLLVPPDDPSELAKAIARILDDAELAANLGKHARATIDQRFTSEIVARTFVGLVAEALKRPPGVRGP